MNNPATDIRTANNVSHPPDLKTLQCFLAVADLGNVTRAAESLYMTQPALSLRLKQLADHYQLTLFHRTSRGLDLTDDGLALVVRARQVISSLNELDRTAVQLHKQVRGGLRIGTVIDPEFIRLGAFLHALVDAAPLLEKELRQGMSGNVREWVLRNEVDAGYFLGHLSQRDGDDQAQGLHQKPLTDFAYWVVAPPGWEARMVDKDWDGLARLPWIGTAQASVHGRLLQKVYSERAAMPRFVAKVDQESSMLAMVRSGIGLSLCRDSVALQEKHRHGLAINERVSIDCTLSFICLKSRQYEGPIACALDVLDLVWSSTAQNGTAELTSQRSTSSTYSVRP
jgi:DNA-binding transcriptional LysR family regulator